MSNSGEESCVEELTEFRVDIPKISMLLRGKINENNTINYPAEFCLDIPNSISMVIDKKRIGSSTHEETTRHIDISHIGDLDEDTRARYLTLYGAALRGDWKTAHAIYQKHPEDKKARISKDGHTALHIAAAANRSKFAMNLLREMDHGDLELTNSEGKTAFCLAAAAGEKKVAQEMKKINGNLLKREQKNSMSPFYQAAEYGRKEMVKWLYEEVTKEDQLKDQLNDVELLINLIENGLYESALDLLRKYPGLAKRRVDRANDPGNDQMTALHALAIIPIANQGGLLEGCFSLWEGCFNIFPCIQYKFGPKKLEPAPKRLVEKLWETVIGIHDDDSEIPRFNESQISDFISKPNPLLSVAVERGNIGFLNILIRRYPDLIFEVDEDNYTLFHYAVMYRQNDIFKFVYEIGYFRDYIFPKTDRQGNNILHLAGKLAPTDRLNIVSGAALQMQRELLWFEAVEELVFPLDAEVTNKEGKTPRALFSESHKELKEKGEKWMKSTADSCMIVATLIATVVFAAAFTVPGGTNETTGTPNFVHEVSLTIFFIADVISLVSSSCSILTFLSLLTYRYTEDAFICRLPTKLLFGIATLFISIVSMMVVFCATYFIVFKEENLMRAIVISGISSIPVILYLYLQFPLFLDLVRSTCFSCSLFQPFPFPRGKLTLFNRKK